MDWKDKEHSTCQTQQHHTSWMVPLHPERLCSRPPARALPLTPGNSRESSSQACSLPSASIPGTVPLRPSPGPGLLPLRGPREPGGSCHVSRIRLYRLSGCFWKPPLCRRHRLRSVFHSDHKVAAEPHAPGPAGVHQGGFSPQHRPGRGGFCQPAPALPLSVLSATAQGSLSPNPSPT